MRSLAWLSGVLLVASACAAGACGPEGEEVASDGAAASRADAFWGDDRVGRKLAGLSEGDACYLPKTFEELETCFGIGRKCTRRDSQEVFVVEEKQTRNTDGKVEPADKAVPRVVVSGCNDGDRTDPASLVRSFGLFVGLFSPRGDTHLGDSLLLSPVEVMALDDTTGLYNFYVFGEDGVTRVFRDKAGKVLERTMTKAGASAAQAPAVKDRCFSCHVNGGPIMNEIADPWTNWVSFKKASSVSDEVAGTTKELVSIAIPDGERGTSSLAGDLEQTMKVAQCRFIAGSGCKKTGAIDPNAPQNGFANAVLTGQQPGGVGRLLRSVFCQTELQYLSANESIPAQVFFDPDAVAAAQLRAVASNGDVRFPHLFPVRSEFDKGVELYLIGKRVLGPQTMTAIRLVDDENDVFSGERCGLLDELSKGSLATEGARLDRRVRELIDAKLTPGPKAFSFVSTMPARAAYIKALVAQSLPAEERNAARDAYLAEVRTRYAEKVAAFQGEGRAAFEERQAERKAAVRTLFGDAHPFPILD